MKRRITRVEIHNYRQYEELIVNFDEDKNIFVFEGKGGSGKSNFLNALSWCLYEDEPLKGKDDADYLLCTHLRIDDEHKSDTISVQIDAIIGKTPVRFVRSRIEMNELGRQQDKFSTFHLKDDDWVEYKNSQYFVDNFLPKSLREFFMFDGENVKSTFKPGYERHIRKNTEVISYTELISRTSEHLNRILGDTRRQLGREAPDLSSMIDQQNQLDTKISSTEKYKKEDDAELARLKDERETYREQQKTIEEFKSLTSSRDTLDRSQEAENKHKENYTQEYQSKIGTIAPYVFLHEEFGKFSKALASLEASGDIPPKITPEYVRDLIEGKVKICVCGHEIDEASRKNLKAILESLDNAQSKSYLLTSNITLASIDYKLKGVQVDLNNLKKNMTETEKRLQTNNLELQAIRKKIGEAGGPIGDLELTIQNLDTAIDNVKQRIWNEEYELKQDREAFTIITRDIALQGDIKNKHEAIAKKIELLESCMKKFDRLGEQSLQESRLKLSEAMKKYFKELYWKKEYSDVYINENFAIVIEKDVNGKTTQMPISQLAGSEGATLGYSLMKGLSELSGFRDTPVFIDGPLSDFSEDMQREFLGSLKEFVPDKQLFVFFKEDTHLVEPYIDKHLAEIQAFKIYREEKAATSTIKEWSK